MGIVIGGIRPCDYWVHGSSSERYSIFPTSRQTTSPARREVTKVECFHLRGISEHYFTGILIERTSKVAKPVVEACNCSMRSELWS